MKRRRRSPSGPRYRALIIERYRGLYSMAVEAVRRGDYEYARRLTGLIKEIAQRTRIRLPRYIKRGICKNCGLPLVPGLTARVRLNTQGGMSYVTVTCLACGWMHRYPYKPLKRRRGGGLGRVETGEPEGTGEESPPQERGRHHRKERDNRGGPGRDQEEA